MDRGLIREVERAKSDIDSVINNLVSEIESLERGQDTLADEIEKLKKRINELEEQLNNPTP